MEYFFIHEIAKPAEGISRFYAACGENIYFENNNNLYSFTKSQMLDINLDITQGSRLEKPEGSLKGMFSHGNVLFVAVQNNNKITLYQKVEDSFHLILDDIDKFYPYYCGYDSLKYIYFAIQINNCNAIYAIDKNLRLCCVQVLPSFYEGNINSIYYKNGELYVAISGKKNILKIKIENESGDLLKPYDIHIIEEDWPVSVFRFAQLQGELVAAQDGATSLVNVEKKLLFSDIKKGESGYQISAFASFFLGSGEITYIGTWRRSHEHPFPCFYILKNSQVIFKHSVPSEYIERLKWTGYNLCNTTYNSDKGEYKDCLFTCDYGLPIYIKNVTKEEYNKMKNLYKTRIIYADEDVIIFGKIGQHDISPSHKLLSSERDKPVYIVPKFAAKKHQGPMRVYLTFDIEQNSPGKPYCLTGSDLPDSGGAYWIMDILEKYGLHGVFFVNIYEHTNFDGVIEQLVKNIDRRGHEVGLHCHPSSHSFNRKKLGDMTREEMEQTVSYGVSFIEKWTGKKPTSFRGGAYSFKEELIPVLKKYGILVDSSLFLHAAIPGINYPTANKPGYWHGILEIPVTTHTIGNRTSKIDINWHTDPLLLMDILLTCHEYGMSDAVFMAHSFSFLNFSKNAKDSPFEFEFTSGRFLLGVNKELKKNFETFCQLLKEHNDTIETKTFKEIVQVQHDFSQSIDVIPHTLKYKNLQKKTSCPICSNFVEFQDYRGRNNALCPICHSLERMRLKYLYLKYNYHIESRQYISVLHFGPALPIQNYLAQLPDINYMTSDPYNTAHFKFNMENIFFKSEMFDLVIAVGVLMHVLDDYKALAEIYRILKPQGELLLWLGPLEEDNTKEHYDRSKFSIMQVGKTNTPHNLEKCVTEEKDGVIYYNPRYRTRTYGKDILIKLKEFGYDVTLIYAKDICGDYEKYGIPQGEFLIKCIKSY